LVLAPYTQFAHVSEKINSADHIFLFGFNPLINDPGIGSGFLIFFMPPYLAYLTLSAIGIHFQFVLETLFKLPPIAGDLLVFVSLKRLTFLGMKDYTKSTLVAATYFLNPYVINASAIVGSYESLMVAFVLLAFLSMFKQQNWRSATYLSIASFMRYFPALLVPFFVVLAWKQAKRSAIGFLVIFSIFSFLLSLPYLFFLVPLYQASPPAFLDWVRYFLGAGGSAPGAVAWPVWQFKWNLTGFLIITGLISQASSIFLNLRTFLALFVVLTILAARRFTRSVAFVNTYLLAFFLLVLVVFPLAQYHYLVWLIPFAILASIGFRQFPMRYVNVIWISYMVIELAIQGVFLGYLDYTFPTAFSQSLRTYWSNNFYNIPLQHAVGVLIWLLMTVVLMKSFLAIAAFYPRSITNSSHLDGMPANPQSRNKSPRVLGKVFLSILSLSIVGSAYLVEMAQTAWLTMLFLGYALAFVLLQTFRSQVSRSSFVAKREISRLRSFLRSGLRVPDKILVSIFLVAIAISLVPLGLAIHVGFIPNARSYSSFSDAYVGVSTNASNAGHNATATILGIDSNRPSWATWQIDAISPSFAGEAMRDAISASIRISGVPISQSGVYADAFNSTGLSAQPYNWHHTGGNGTFADNGTVMVPAEATFLSISSDPGRWFSSDNTTTIRLNVSIVGNAVWSLTIFRDDNWWTPYEPNDPNPVHTSAGLFVFYVPPGHQFRYPSLFVQSINNSLPAVAKFESLEYLGLLNSASASVSVKSQTVFQERLDYDFKGSFYLPPDPNSINSIIVPVDISLFDPMTILNITVGKNSSWPLRSVTLELFGPISGSLPLQFSTLSLTLSGLFGIVAFAGAAGPVSRWVRRRRPSSHSHDESPGTRDQSPRRTWADS
jgi:hypothetical protein